MAISSGAIRCKKVKNAVAIALSLFTLAVSAATQSATVNPEELIRKVVHNEQSAERQDDSHWMFRLDTQNKNGQKDSDEVCPSP